jgi:hypothetical protein
VEYQVVLLFTEDTSMIICMRSMMNRNVPSFQASGSLMHVATGSSADP